MANIVDKTISVTEFRAKMQGVIKACSKKGQRYKVMCHNEVAAVLVSPAEWAMMLETLSILDDSNLMDQIRDAQKEIDAGEARPAKDVFDELLEDSPE